MNTNREFYRRYKMLSETEIRRQLQNEIDRRCPGVKLDDDAWNFLKRRENDKSLFDHWCTFADATGRLRPIMRVSEQPSGNANLAQVRQTAKRALMDAANDDDVRHFRAEALRGKLISPKNVEAWIRRRVKKEGPSTCYVSFALSADALDWNVKEGLKLRRSIGRHERPVERWLETLDVPTNAGWTDHVPVVKDGVLDRLRQLSTTLASRYGWRPDEAVRFVLTGDIPFIPPMEINAELSEWGHERIMLSVDPATTPRELERFYRQERKRFMPGRSRRQSPKHSELAQFLAPRLPPATGKIDADAWRELMASWNDAHPAQSYDDWQHFKRDARTAQRRLREPKLSARKVLGIL